jgi:hypothetical protein
MIGLSLNAISVPVTVVLAYMSAREFDQGRVKRQNSACGTIHHQVGSMLRFRNYALKCVWIVRDPIAEAIACFDINTSVLASYPILIQV